MGGSVDNTSVVVPLTSSARRHRPPVRTALDITFQWEPETSMASHDRARARSMMVQADFTIRTHIRRSDRGQARQSSRAFVLPTNAANQPSAGQGFEPLQRYSQM